ncbi:hypothetical protein MMC10_001372 [Thelotrema lepadinum]|nr:hypothetical protein [Thelotrema lepadinum]
MSSSQERPIEIAIIGGGFAGLALAIGLQHYQHINVQVYEGAHKFSEIGAGVMLGPNAQHAMDLIDPQIKEGYERRAAIDAGPPDENGMWAWMSAVKGQAPDVNQSVVDFRYPMRGSTVHRAHFLDELIKMVEPERAHFGKRLDRIYKPDDGESSMIIHFKDGTTASADIVIGADGVHSVVRKDVLGSDHPAATAVYSGTIVYRAIVPIEDAKAKLGDFEQKPLGIRCGKNGWVMGFPMSNNTKYYIAVITATHSPQEHDKWVASPADLDAIKPIFEDWDDDSRNLVELLPSDGSTTVWSVWEMPPAPTFFKGRVALMGDAAHASTPYQGAGAGQAIEDALILQQLLAKCLDPSTRSSHSLSTNQTIPLILQAYDTTRRFRSQKVVIASNESGRILTGNEPGVGLGASEINKRTEGRLRWIWDLDQEQQVRDTFQVFESLKDAIERIAPNYPTSFVG